MNKSLYESRYKKNTIQSDLVSVILGFNYFLLNIYILYKTPSNTHIYIKILQIQCKYIQYNKYFNR